MDHNNFLILIKDDSNCNTVGVTFCLLLFAGLGFIAVFAGATNTPIACTLMGVELFGSNNVVYYAVACFTAYYFSGHTGIYGSQRIAVSKFHQTQKDEYMLKEMRNINKK